MSNLPNDQTAIGPDQSSTESQCSCQPLDSLKTAILRGAENARREVDEGIPKVRAAAAEAAYWMAYGISFAGIFAWTVAKNLAPEAVSSGCRDGLKAGEHAARRWTDERRTRTKPETAALLPAPAQSGPDSAQPGVA